MCLYWLKIKILPNMTDGDIRAELWKNRDNSAYSTSVCRKCGVFRPSPDGDSRTCPITDSCSACENNEPSVFCS